MQETILCAAILYHDFPTPVHTCSNVEGVVMCGYRHGMIIGQVSNLLGCPQHRMGKSTQGFLTSENRFLDRVEALELFKQNGGTPEFGDELYSEDLY